MYPSEQFIKNTFQREKASKLLIKHALQYGTSDEDQEDANHFRRLARANSSGTLSVEEAKFLLNDFFENEAVLIDLGEYRYLLFDRE